MSKSYLRWLSRLWVWENFASQKRQINRMLSWWRTWTARSCFVFDFQLQPVTGHEYPVAGLLKVHLETVTNQPWGCKLYPFGCKSWFLKHFWNKPVFFMQLGMITKISFAICNEFAIFFLTGNTAKPVMFDTVISQLVCSKFTLKIAVWPTTIDYWVWRKRNILVFHKF